MQPKKRILLIDHDEYRASVCSFMLATHAYLIIPAATAQTALDMFSETFPNVVLANASFPGLGGLLNALHERDGYIPQVVVSDALSECNVLCDAWLCKPTAAELLDRVRTISARKKGPRTATPDVSFLRQQLTTRRTA